MRVLGVDPGTRRLGWGVVERAGTRLVHVAHGVVEPGEGALPDRLVTIAAALARVAVEHRPDAGAVEALYYGRNAQSAAKLGHARGVVLLELRRARLPVAEYAPALVKRAVACTGRAEKSQLARFVAQLLALGAPPPEDAADALAVAITHLGAVGFREAVAEARAARQGPR
jgi:crossover junction endodeoxyribonuclease RuvC